MNGSGKQHQLTAGCNKYNIKILAIQEHRQIFEDQEVKYEWNDEGTWLKVLFTTNKDGTGRMGFFIERKVTKILQAVTIFVIVHPNDDDDDDDSGRERRNM